MAYEMNLLKGIRLYEQQDYEGALEILDTLMIQAPEAEVAYYLARTHVALGNQKQARLLLRYRETNQ